jgi:LPS O-antigen subunit length determinant protein (WzzB/FepE family)
MDKEFNLIAAIRTILKWKMHILVLTITSGIIAAIFSVFVMDEWFLSWSTFYPTNQALNDRTAIFNTDASVQMEYFGSKQDVNRILTIANSNPVIDYVIDSFKLAEHYKVEKDSKYWKTKVRKKFEKKYEAIKTEHDAVQVSFYDTDPKVAAAVVNAVIEKVDELNKAHVTDTKEKSYEAIAKQTLKLQADVNGYIDTLAELGQQYKIKVSSGADGTIIVDGSDYHAVQLYKSIMAKQTNATRELNNLTNIKGQLDVSMQNSETSLYVLESAFPADRREKPVRSLVVILTMLITAFVSVLGVLLIEQIREIKAQL